MDVALAFIAKFDSGGGGGVLINQHLLSVQAYQYYLHFLSTIYTTWWYLKSKVG